MDTVRTVGMALDRALPATNEEALLVAELQAGSEEAFAYLLRVYQNPVFNLVWHILENQAEAADVLQDAFIKVFKGIRQFHGDSSLKTWIYRIAVHEASNHRRGWMRRHLHEPLSIDDTGAEVALSAAEAWASPETPYRLLEQAERQELLRRTLASLGLRGDCASDRDGGGNREIPSETGPGIAPQETRELFWQSPCLKDALIFGITIRITWMVSVSPRYGNLSAFI
jgi:RNA polymerase sigma factor (sigma-70 family)